VTDVYGVAQFRLSVAALVFAGTGTDAAQHARQKVGHVVDGIRPIVSAFKEGSDVGWDVRCRRTGGLARDIQIHVIKVFRAG
jgi:hypothetical protein